MVADKTRFSHPHQNAILHAYGGIGRRLPSEPVRSRQGALTLRETSLHGQDGSAPRGKSPKAAAAGGVGAHAWIGLWILFFVNMANYADRMVISVLMPSIKAELALSDTQLGLLTGFAFAIFYAVAGLPIARLADRGVRKNIIAVSVAIWSCMTALSGLAQNYWQLLLARMGVATGEAGCLPTAQSMLSDYFPAEKRSSAMALFTAGSTIGISVGVILGGWLDAAFGWRLTFMLIGLPGVALAAIAFFALREPRRGSNDAASRPADIDMVGVRQLLQVRRSYIHLAMIVASGNFVSFGLAQWMPSFYARTFEASMQDVGTWYGLVNGAGLVIGTVGGGYLGDWYLRRGARSVLAFSAVTIALAFLLKLALFVSPSFEVALSFNFGSSVVNMLSHGPVFALVATAVPAHLRAQATALLMLLSSLVGWGAGPLFVGVASDLFAAGGQGADSLRWAMLACTGLALWPIVHIVLAARHVEDDTGFRK